MLNSAKIIPMVLSQVFGAQKLMRVREPSSVTADYENVVQYDRVMSTKLAINYAIALEVIHRARTITSDAESEAIDLACGPGHFTLCLKKYFGFDKITGVDLSPGMVGVAQKNATSQQLANCFFEVGDITNLEKFSDDTFDLTSFTGAAHHMADLSVVGSTLRQMDRITKPDGLVLLMDLARLRTAKLTEFYVDFLGADYVKQGLPDFLTDFRNSMYAAWTTDELSSVVPKQSRRVWIHFYPRLLPSMQFILGLPVGRTNLFCRRGLPWKVQESPIPSNMRAEWRLARMTLFGVL